MTFKSVLVVNAGGVLGYGLMMGFIYQGGWKIRALCRKKHLETPTPIKADILRIYKENNVEIMEQKLDDAKSLDEACEGMDVVVSAVGVESVDLQVPLIEAAERAGVKRFVPSDFQTDVGALSADAEALMYVPKQKIFVRLQESSMEWTRVYCGGWYEAAPFLFFIDLKKYSMAHFGHRSVLYSYITCEDIGRLLPLALNHPSSRNNSVYFQSEVLSNQQITNLYEKHFNHTFKVTVIPRKEMERHADTIKTMDLDNIGGPGSPNFPALLFVSQLWLVIMDGHGVLPEKSWNAEYMPDYKCMTGEQYLAELAVNKIKVEKGEYVPPEFQYLIMTETTVFNDIASKL